jgi:hypothetical protein
MNKIQIIVIGVITSIVAMIGIGIGTYIPQNVTTKIELPDYPIDSPPSSEEYYTLNIGWNLVSMPDTINKTNVYIIYNSITYNWTNAINNLIIYDNVYGYNGTSYFKTSSFVESKGYWLYSLKEPVLMTTQSNTIFCNKLYFDGTDVLSCTNLVISPSYPNTIHCKSINVQTVSMIYDDVGLMEED